MAVQLQKGQTISLKKEAPNLKKLLVGLGWDPIRKLFRSSNMDIDASVICIDTSGKKNALVYYGELSAYKKAILHHGDNLTGDGDGDDEQIEICLDKIPDNIERLSVIINIYSAYSRNQDFSMVKNCFVHIDDMDTNKVLAEYSIDGNFDKLTGIYVADVYRYNGEWKFKAIGQGVRVGSIDEMVAQKCG